MRPSADRWGKKAKFRDRNGLSEGVFEGMAHGAPAGATTRDENGVERVQSGGCRRRKEAGFRLEPMSPSVNVARDAALEQRSGASAA